MKFHSCAVAAALLLGATASQAAVVFADNFDASIAGLNVVPTGWTVTDGTVDVVSGTTFCQSGQCVDLDGSTGNAGVLSRSFDLIGGVAYTLAFDISGSNASGFEGRLDDTTLLIRGDVSVAAIPEPETYLLMVTGLLVVARVAHRRRERRDPERVFAS